MAITKVDNGSIKEDLKTVVDLARTIIIYYKHRINGYNQSSNDFKNLILVDRDLDHVGIRMSQYY